MTTGSREPGKTLDYNVRSLFSNLMMCLLHF